MRKRAAMNLPLPSGSSPPEKPPGSTRSSGSSWMALRHAADGLSSMSAAVRLLHHQDLRAPRPARSKARAVSYSQLVPGKTGMSTRGRATCSWGAGWVLCGPGTAWGPPPPRAAADGEHRRQPALIGALQLRQAGGLPAGGEGVVRHGASQQCADFRRVLPQLQQERPPADGKQIVGRFRRLSGKAHPVAQSTS